MAPIDEPNLYLTHFLDLLNHDPLSQLDLSAPSRKTVAGVLIFLVASVAQHICHQYLASLPKYTLPQHPFFRSIVCPHYTAECLIYLSITVLSTPRGQSLNKTMFTGLGFVVVNLGVTADSARTWYTRKFGQNQISGRWRMIPYVF